jgi:hypothetical protein
MIFDDANGPCPGVTGHFSCEKISHLAVRGIIVKISHLFAALNLHHVSPALVASHLFSSSCID